MFLRIGGLTIEAGQGFSIRLANGAEVLMQPCRGAERGLWATLREPGSWQVWAGWFSIIAQSPVKRPAAAA